MRSRPLPRLCRHPPAVDPAPSASVVPAALAVAELVDADGPRVLDAIAVGIETVVRLGMAGYDRSTNNSLFFEHGQHATSICGTVGAAVAASLTDGLARDPGRRAVMERIRVVADPECDAIYPYQFPRRPACPHP